MPILYELKDHVARVTIDRAHLNEVILGAASLSDQIAAARAAVDGDEQALHDFLALLDDFEFWFNLTACSWSSFRLASRSLCFLLRRSPGSSSPRLAPNSSSSAASTASASSRISLASCS